MTQEKNWNPPKQRTCQVIRTRKYFAVVCTETWGGSYHSRAGWSAWTPRNEGSLTWLGANMRKALLSSEDNKLRYGHPIPREVFEPAKRAMGMAEFHFWAEIVNNFKFKDKKSAQSKSALIFCSWKYEETEKIRLLATKGFGPGHSAWSLGENNGRVFHVDLAASDEKLGLVITETLDKCEPNYV